MLRKVLAGALVGVLGLGLVGCGSETAGEVAEAGTGSLVLYTSQPEDDVQQLIEGFNEEYPDIKVDVFRTGTEEIISKVLAEDLAGGTLNDLLLVADATSIAGLKADDMLASYQSPELEGIDSAYYDTEDYMFTGTKILTSGIIYNTNNITEAPTSWNDLTTEAYKSETIMPTPLYSGSAAYNLSVLKRTDGFGIEYYEALKANDIKVDKGNGAIQTAVVEGEKSAGIIVDFMAIRSKLDGAPVEFVYPEEGSLVVTEPVALMSNAKNVENAKLFIDFILSVKGQELTAEIGYTPIKEGVAAPEGFRSADEIENVTIDITTLIEVKEDDKAEFTSIFG